MAASKVHISTKQTSEIAKVPVEKPERELLTDQQRRAIYAALAEIGRKLPTNKKQGSRPEDGTDRRSSREDAAISAIPTILATGGSFDNAACVLVINCIKVNELVIMTAEAAEIIDIVNGDVLQSKAWKLLQKMPPHTAAMKAGVEMNVMRELVIQHESNCGYYFVDRSPATFTFNTVIQAVSRMAAICGKGCFSYEADMFVDKTIFDFEIKRLPIRNLMSIQRTPDIVKDVAEHSKLVMNYLRQKVIINSHASPAAVPSSAVVATPISNP
jgi:hypothetical protein